MSAPTFDLAAAHRWFAIEFNNAAWDFVEAASRSPDDVERLLHLAHAACLHWSSAGTPLNRLRGLALLAHAYAIAGYGRAAVDFARRCTELCAELGDQPTAFDRAAAAACMACALRSDGQSADADSWERKALALAKDLDDPDDQKVIERLVAIGRS
jgi:hypothetical protein